MRLPSYQELSKEQDAVNNLPLEGSYLITGPPGTGKTVMALYRTEMLSDRGADVQLLMYSRLLSNYVRSAVDELDLDGASSTFHSWLYRFYRHRYRSNLPQIRPYQPDWTAVLTKINEDPPPAGSMPFLIVDEGQDLAADFFYIAQHIAKHLTVFADENQQLYDENSTLDEIRANAGVAQEDVHTLTRNYRNTREIATLARCFYTGLRTGVPDLPRREGERPALIQFDTLNATVDYIARFERTHSDLEIGVLVPTRRLQKKLINRLDAKGTANPVQYYDSNEKNEVDFDEPGIRVVNYKSAKGLEFDVVFLPELQELTYDPASAKTKMMFYVLISRARDELYLSYSGDEEPPLLTMFPREHLESR
jgi:superfamily I DNA/RNA helicase